MGQSEPWPAGEADVAESASWPYPRSVDLEFMQRCHPRIADFYRYWEGKRGARRMPSRADMVPAEMKIFLPGIVLVAVQYNPMRLKYRLVGTREVEYRGYDPTGKDVAEHFAGSSQHEVLRNYELVIESRSFVYDEDCLLSADHTFQEAGTLLLPLSDDGETVNMVIVYNHYRLLTAGASQPKPKSPARAFHQIAEPRIGLR
ncbi:MAG TPA: PAS domain-containing protein [Dongiaceae bacterium]|jgi:hypothetical protein